jgi:hypothetical protein
MYGIVNKAIEDLVTANFGEDKWQAVKERSGVDIDFFISSEPYDDEVTFLLANAVAAEMGMHIDAVFNAFGEWWILKIGKEKYGGLMEAGGKHLKEFLLNLPVFHNRIMMIYPKITPPEFRISDVEDSQLCLHYFSKREGLREFVRGLMTGLGKMYNTPLQVELVQEKVGDDGHEVFKLIW